eukprot:1328294-Amorphochlora_amoeboformis.AAC.1
MDANLYSSEGRRRDVFGNTLPSGVKSFQEPVAHGNSAISNHRPSMLRFDMSNLCPVRVSRLRYRQPYRRDMYISPFLYVDINSPINSLTEAISAATEARYHKAAMNAEYATFGAEKTLFEKMTTKKAIKYTVVGAIAVTCLCIGVSFALAGPSSVAAPIRAGRGVASRVSVPTRSAASRTRVHGGGSFVQPGGPFDPKRWGKVETLERAENEVNMGLTPTDIPPEIKGTPLETSYKDPFYAHSFPSFLDYLNSGLAGKNYKPKDKAPMISYWR